MARRTRADDDLREALVTSPLTIDPEYCCADGFIAVGKARIQVRVWVHEPGTAEVEYYGNSEPLLKVRCVPPEIMAARRSGRKDGEGFRISRSHQGDGYYRIVRRWPVDRAHELPGVQRSIVEKLVNRALARTSAPPAKPAAQEINDEAREKIKAEGVACAWLQKHVLSPGVEDTQVGPLLRELLQLSTSRRGAHALLFADRGKSPLPYIVARLRALPPWRPQLVLVVDNAGEDRPRA